MHSECGLRDVLKRLVARFRPASGKANSSTVAAGRSIADDVRELAARMDTRSRDARDKAIAADQARNYMDKKYYMGVSHAIRDVAESLMFIAESHEGSLPPWRVGWDDRVPSTSKANSLAGLADGFAARARACDEELRGLDIIPGPTINFIDSVKARSEAWRTAESEVRVFAASVASMLKRKWVESSVLSTLKARGASQAYWDAGCEIVGVEFETSPLTDNDRSALITPAVPQQDDHASNMKAPFKVGDSVRVLTGLDANRVGIVKQLEHNKFHGMLVALVELQGSTAHQRWLWSYRVDDLEIVQS